MKCLILAAGRGDRLSPKAVSKPLLKILGLRLIERSILTAAEAGCREFYVVTGYRSAEVEDFLVELAGRIKLPITPVYNEEWETEDNGASVLKAAPFLGEKFLLIMSDHIFDIGILRDLARLEIGSDEVILAVDRRIQDNTDVVMDDVTKVLVHGDKIGGIGKRLTDFNAFDTGAFLCTPAIFDALVEGANQGDTTLSGSIGVLAGNGKAKAFDSGSLDWKDVDTPEDVAVAQKILYRSLTKPLDGWVARYINRRFSLHILTPCLLKIKEDMTPNQASFITLIVGLLAAVCLFFHLPAAGGFLLQFSSILDGCDGEIARLKKMQSPIGGFIDSILDRFTDSVFLMAMFYYCLTEEAVKDLLGIGAVPVIVTATVFAIVGNFLVSYTSSKSVSDLGYRYVGGLIAAGKGRDIRLLIISIGCVLGSLIHPVSILITLCLVAAATSMITTRRLFLSVKYAFIENSLLSPGLKAVVFDFDGTIADTMPFLTELAVDLMVENYSISRKDAEKKYLLTTGIDFGGQLEIIFPGHQSNKKTGDAFEARKVKEIANKRPFTEVIPVLQFLRSRDLKVFLCSSTNREIIAKYLVEHRLSDWFNDFQGFQSGNDKRRQLETIISAPHLKGQEILFVGDSIKDAELAASMKIPFRGVTRIFRSADFQKCGADSVPDLTALMNLWKASDYSRKFLEFVGTR